MGKAQSKVERVPDASTKPPQAASKNSVTTRNLNTDYLLEPPDESSIKRSWTHLGSLIDSHVDHFYNNTVHLGQRSESIKGSLKDSNIVQESGDIEELAELLETPEYRKLGLRVCIARAILSSIDFYGYPEKTSLDPLVVELLRRFNRLRPSLNPEQEAALSHWRMITAFFLQPGSECLRENSLPCLKLLTDFLAIFRPAPDSGLDGRDWAGSLRTIAQQGIEVGEKLFCHPSNWLFEWHLELDDAHPPTRLHETTTKEIKKPSLIVLFPALIEPLGGYGGLKKQRVNVVQAADTAPGLVFLEGKITPISASFSLYSPSSTSSPTEAPSLAPPSTLEHGAEDRAIERRRKKRESVSTISAGALQGAPEVLPPVRPIRRASTIASVSQPRGGATGRGAGVGKRKDSINSH
ncbi:hypothetical protein ANO14919_035250 [Xylariales sp. No.14919]|nr:hypothetical protein ANO14919_035250 [Xylariales sp. No.14919]